MRTPDTVVWVTGGTSGVGAGLIRSVPYSDARIINIARRANPDVENFIADLADPDSWGRLRLHLREELASFSGRRAIFIHNAASLSDGTGYAGQIDPKAHDAHVLINVAAPLVVGEAFLAASPEGLEAGLVMVSSTASTSLPVTRASYGAGKAGIEQWVRAVREERRLRGHGPWVVAVLPGSVDTPGLRRAAATEDSAYPRAKALRETLERGLMQSPDQVARAIWSILPPQSDGPAVIRVGPTSVPIQASEFTK